MTKNCKNCGHALGSFKNYGVCVASGLYLTTERKYNAKCDKDFSAWKPKNPSLLEKIFKCWSSK